MRKKNPPKNPSAFITHVKGSGEMRREVQRLRNADYDVLLPGTHIRRNGTERSWSDLISTILPLHFSTHHCVRVSAFLCLKPWLVAHLLSHQTNLPCLK